MIYKEIVHFLGKSKNCLGYTVPETVYYLQKNTGFN